MLPSLRASYNVTLTILKTHNPSSIIHTYIPYPILLSLTIICTTLTMCIPHHFFISLILQSIRFALCSSVAIISALIFALCFASHILCISTHHALLTLFHYISDPTICLDWMIQRPIRWSLAIFLIISCTLLWAAFTYATLFLLSSLNNLLVHILILASEMFSLTKPSFLFAINLIPPQPT